MKKIVLIIVFFIIPIFCFAQDIDKIVDSAYVEFNNKNFEKALQLFLSVENSAIEKYGENSSQDGTLKFYIGMTYIILGSRDKAYEYLKKSYNILKPIPGVNPHIFKIRELSVSPERKYGNWFLG